MSKKANESCLRAFLLSLLISFFSISIVSTAILSMFLSQSNRSRQNELRTTEENAVNTISYFITYKINRLTSDLEFVTNMLRDHYQHASDYSDVASIWLDYSSCRTVYDQIRYIDMNGNEIIRVNHGENGAYLVPMNELQNKKEYDYFQSTMLLDRNQVFVSALDLNVENNRIEQPQKPMIRLGTPFFNAAGQKAGIVILNYSAHDILQQVQAIATSMDGSVSLLNADGYWLFCEADNSKEWAFQLNPGSGVDFASEYPQEWSAIQSGLSNTIQTKNGFFHFTRLSCSDILQSAADASTVLSQVGDWYIVSSIPSTSPEWHYFNNQIDDLLLYIAKRYYVFYLVFIGISLITAFLFVSNQSKKEQVKYYSEFDAMTNSYNRSAGIRRLNAMQKNLAKNNCVVSICFLDVNGLKRVNDVLGHEAGDELLVTVASTVRRNIRSNDFMIRLGGDEFVIVFAGMDTALSEQVWARIAASFESINRTEHRPYVVSVSHGIQEMGCGATLSLDDILHLADEKMYEEKRRIKSSLDVIQQ